MKNIGDHFAHKEGGARADRPYEYREWGLRGIFLHNGFDVVERGGEQYVAIINTDGAHLVRNRKSLAQDEIRFLRKTMDITQAELGRWMGQSSQQADRPYEYRECGLRGIFLHNGFEVVERDGEQYVAIINTDGLQCAIGAYLVRNRKSLAQDEIRFLRKTMDMTQAELGRWMGQSSQQVARWEKGQSEIPGPADRLLREIFRLKTMEPDERGDFLNLLKAMEDMEEMDDITPRRIQLYLKDGAWSGRRRAAI